MLRPTGPHPKSLSLRERDFNFELRKNTLPFSLRRIPVVSDGKAGREGEGHYRNLARSISHA